MKKILSILGAITLIGTSSTSLVACNKSNEYTAEQLKELKEKNKINTKDKTIRDNLEWMASQEKPFNKVDNKWYYVVWRGNKNNSWKIVKFKNNTNNKKELDSDGRYIIFKEYSSFFEFILIIRGKRSDADHIWKNNNNQYFKSVYRWNLDTKEPDLILDKNDNLKVKN